MLADLECFEWLRFNATILNIHVASFGQSSQLCGTWSASLVQPGLQ